MIVYLSTLCLGLFTSRSLYIKHLFKVFCQTYLKKSKFWIKMFLFSKFWIAFFLFGKRLRSTSTTAFFLVNCRLHFSLRPFSGLFGPFLSIFFFVWSCFSYLFFSILSFCLFSLDSSFCFEARVNKMWFCFHFKLYSRCWHL